MHKYLHLWLSSVCQLFDAGNSDRLDENLLLNAERKENLKFFNIRT
jgi:hypothetical protein